MNEMSISDALLYDAEWWIGAPEELFIDIRVEKLRQEYMSDYSIIFHDGLYEMRNSIDSFYSLLIREAIKDEQHS